MLLAGLSTRKGSRFHAPTSNTGTEEKETGAPELSSAQRARIERNRQKALLLKESRLANQPYSYTIGKDGSVNILQII